jgi:hypothetical protein
MPDQDEFDARLEAELDAAIEADLQAEKAKRRAEIAARLRQKAAMAELDRINARHPIQGPGDPKVEAERRRIMAERAKADNEWMDRVNAKPADGDLRAQRAESKGGAAGFTIKG